MEKMLSYVSKSTLVHYERMRILNRSDASPSLGILGFPWHAEVHPRSFREMIEVPWRGARLHGVDKGGELERYNQHLSR